MDFTFQAITGAAYHYPAAGSLADGKRISHRTPQERMPRTDKKPFGKVTCSNFTPPTAEETRAFFAKHSTRRYR